MIELEDFKKFLPQYLTSESEKDLFSELKEFPNNIDYRLYTDILKDQPVCFQGDGLNDMLFINLPDTKIGSAPGVILSNTCDIDQSNNRLFPMRAVYTPIFQLEKYKAQLIKDHVETGKKTFHLLMITQTRLKGN